MTEKSPPAPASRRTRRLWTVAAVLAVVGIAYVGIRTWSAARAGVAGRRALVQAQADLEAHRLQPARAHLLEARADFRRMHGDVHSLGPVLPLAKLVPVLRQQVRGVEVFSDSGLLLSDAGLRLDDAARGILEPTDERLKVSAALETLRSVHAAMRSGVKSLDEAAKKVKSLDGYNLFGPLGTARADLARRLPDIQGKARSAESGLGALIAFAGGSGPRRYLVLSQNPDEVRPTGGFIGTYGLLVADGSQLRLERYDSIESWTHGKPQATVPADEAGIVFRLQAPPVNQTLANVNSVPDWPSASRLAVDLWEKGGEAPVDGVVSFTPGLIGRILEVTGPVVVPAYDDTVSAANFQERLDFHLYRSKPVSDPTRKDFVAALAQVTLQRLLEAPSSQWDALARAVGAALGSQQAMAWSKDPALAAELARRRWDGALPETRGDFFAAGEFAYAAKNGRGLRRTYEHHVALRADGSAHIETTVTVDNTQPPDPIINPGSLTYMTLYGPHAAVLGEQADHPALAEKEVSQHPAYGWFRAAPPMGQTVLKTAWDAPDIAHRTADGTWVYNLWWRRIVDHPGDVLKLRVDLPPGWEWKGAPPPSSIDLNADVIDTWTIAGR